MIGVPLPGICAIVLLLLLLLLLLAVTEVPRDFEAVVSEDPAEVELILASPVPTILEVGLARKLDEP